MPSTHKDSARSSDGTQITYDRSGEGPALVFVDGAFCTRAMGPGHTLAPVVSDRSTTFVYDRRGRGDSGDTPNYEPHREIEDLASVIEAAGGSAYVFGHSSGAVLALEAARAGLPIRGLILYEPPVVLDNTSSSGGHRLPAADGRPGGCRKKASRGQSLHDRGDPGAEARGGVDVDHARRWPTGPNRPHRRLRRKDHESLSARDSSASGDRGCGEGAHPGSRWEQEPFMDSNGWRSTCLVDPEWQLRAAGGAGSHGESKSNRSRSCDLHRRGQLLRLFRATVRRR